MKIHLNLWLPGLLCCLGANSANAQATLYCGQTACPPLPAAVGAVHLTNSQTFDLPPPGGQLSGPFSSGSIVYGPNPVITSSSAVTGTLAGGVSNIAYTELTYFFRIATLAPTAVAVPVPIVISGIYSLGTTVSGRGLGEALVTLRTNVSGFPTLFEDLLSNSAACTSAPCTRTASYALSGTVFTGVTLSLTLEAYAYGQADFGAAAGGTAMLDPYIAIDPGWPNAAAYAVTVSPQVGNAAAVPEPASALSLLAGGLALAAWRIRHGRARKTRSFTTRQGMHP